MVTQQGIVGDPGKRGAPGEKGRPVSIKIIIFIQPSEDVQHGFSFNFNVVFLFFFFCEIQGIQGPLGRAGPIGSEVAHCSLSKQYNFLKQWSLHF